MGSLYAKVAMSISHADVDRLFSYKIPVHFLEKVFIGSMVLVPFGRNNKKYEGYVIEISDECDYPDSKLKNLVDVVYDYPIFSSKQIELAFWMQKKYFSTFYSCLKVMKPMAINIKSEFIIGIKNFENEDDLNELEKELIGFVVDGGNEVLENDIIYEFGKNAKTKIMTLVKSGVFFRKSFANIKNKEKLIKCVFLNSKCKDLISKTNDLSEKNENYRNILTHLEKNNGVAVSELKSVFGISDSPIKTLEKYGIVIVKNIEIFRNPIYEPNEQSKKTFTLNKEQNEAVKVIKDMSISAVKKPVLLYGVTGSGKTEVYISSVKNVIEMGKTAIVLVPEIVLTSQVVRIFTERFGDEVAVTHSRLSAGERYDQWRKAKNGIIKIMIGTRSAIFAPLDNLGIIIIDEEHENAYRSDQAPKYLAAEVGEKICEINDAVLVLGSATPRIESFYKAENGQLAMAKILKRINRTLPTIEICDMRIELAKGNKSIFSENLLKAMKETLENDKQMILFLNRRGFATFVSCRVCGTVMKCNNCDVNYTYHSYSGKLSCHYCGDEIPNPKNCDICGSTHIRHFGIGTERVEEEVKNIFPNENILRMDLDTTKGKYGHDKIIEKFRNKESKILIGTQMIAKGLDFPDVTLVGVIAADLSIHTGEYKSGENTFQLLTQVSGRAGRSESLGRVFIQTYNPDQYCIKYARTMDYDNFYKEEISYRKQLNYPPFSNVFMILFTGEDERNIIVILHRLLDFMNRVNKKGNFEMLGPTPAVISKINNKYRWKIIVKGEDEDLLKMYVLYCVNKIREKENFSAININLTMNPNAMI